MTPRIPDDVWIRHADIVNRALWRECEDARAHVVSRIPEILAKLGPDPRPGFFRRELRWELTRWVRAERKRGLQMRHGAVMPKLDSLDAMWDTRDGELLGHEVVEGDASPESWLSAAELAPDRLARMAPGPAKRDTIHALRLAHVLG